MALQRMLLPIRGTLVTGAAWTSDGTMTANMQLPGSRTASKKGILYNMTSSSLQIGGVALNKHVRSESQRVNYERPVTVRTIDFSSWLAQRYCDADSERRQ